MQGVKKVIDGEGNLWIEIDEWRASDKIFETITEYGTDVKLKDVPANCRIHALCIAIKNKESGDVTVIIKDGGNQVYPEIKVSADELKILPHSQIEGLNFEESITVRIEGSYTNGTEIFIGYLIENNTPEASP